MDNFGINENLEEVGKEKKKKILKFKISWGFLQSGESKKKCGNSAIIIKTKKKKKTYILTKY